jgi:hypothetical protein
VTSRLPFLLLALLVLLPRPAPAWTDAAVTATVKGWEGETGDEGNGSAAALYARLLSRSSSERFHLTLDLYGRAEQGREKGDWDKSSLYSLAVTGETLDGSLSATAGRQMLDVITGSRVLDGVSARVAAGDFTFSGRRGEVANVAGGSPTGTVDQGIGVRARLREGMFLTLDYDRTGRGGAVQTERAALDWSYDWFRASRAYLTLGYDLLSLTFDRSRFGARWPMSDNVAFAFEHHESIDSFESSDIYSVFAVDAARTDLFQVLLSASSRLRYHWEYALETYASGGGGRRSTVGARYSREGTAASVDFTQQSGDFGRLTEIGLSGALPLGPALTLGAGAEGADVEEKDAPGRATGRLWLGADWKTGTATRLSARIEHTSAEGEDNAWAGRLALTREF